jgi:hypothetical protein
MGLQEAEMLHRFRFVKGPKTADGRLGGIFAAEQVFEENSSRHLPQRYCEALGIRRVSCCGWFRRRDGFYREIRSADDGVVGEQVDGGDFDGVAARSQRGYRDETFDGELLAALVKMAGSFHSAPDFLLVLGDAIDDGDVGLVGSLVQLQIVKLKKNAQLVSAQEFLAETRANFVRVEDELASAGLARRNRFNLIGKYQGTCVKLVVFKVGDTQSSVEDTEAAAQGVFDDEIEAVKAGTERDGFLIDGREIQRRLEEGVRKVAGNEIFESLNDDTTGSGDAAIEIQDCGMHSLFGLKAKGAIGNLDGNGHEDGTAGDAKKIGAIVHVNVVMDYVGVDQFGESF